LLVGEPARYRVPVQGDTRVLLSMTFAVAACAPASLTTSTGSGSETSCAVPKPEDCAASPSETPEPPPASFSCSDGLVDLYADRGGNVLDGLFLADDGGIAVSQFDVVELWRPGLAEPSATCW
jgi:hypothetical protein